MRTASHHRRAFTLLELLVVIGIVAVLSALVIPQFERMQEQGRVTTCLSHLRQIGTALTGYLGEHEARMPELVLARESLDDKRPTLDTVLLPYAQSPAIFACPSDHKHLATITGTSYFWNIALNRQPLASLNLLGITELHSRIPVVGDKEGFHVYQPEKVNVLYADGHASKELTFSTDEMK